jgi:HAE1 family hydrophobic/amphiphilic exporter-1
MKLADLSIKRPVLATVMVGVLVVFGVTAYFRLGIDLLPDIDFPFVTITAVYPGADPETVESRVVDKIEEAVNQVNGLKLMSSSSMENVGFILMQFELEVNGEKAVQDVRDKVAGVIRELPQDLEPPIVEKFDVNTQPIMAVALSGPLPPRDLTALAKDVLKERLQTIRGVGGVEIVGGQEREFKVWVDPEKVESFGLSVSDVMGALMAQNAEIPGGRIDMGNTEFAVKIKGQVHSARELSDIAITSIGGAPIRIGDVAAVEDGQVERRSLSAINDESAVALLITKQSGANTVAVADMVKKTLESMKEQVPKGVRMSIPTDSSDFIKQSIEGVQEDLLLGGILAVVIILFFLRDWRATLISALALPTSVIATFAFIKAAGFTFNMMTMLALSLSIGMLIDDAIVVIENIHRHLEMGKSPFKAASEAVDEIGLAVLATTLSIVAVFVPVATMKGMVGRFFKQFGLTVTFAVLMSLFVAFTLTPMLSSRLLRTGHRRKEFVVFRWIGAYLQWLDSIYRRLLGAALRHRAITVISAIVIFIASLGMTALVPVEFMTTEDRGQIKVNVELPSGMSLAATEKYVQDVAVKIRKIPGVDYTFTTIGGGRQPDVNQAQIQVNFVGKHRRAFSQDEAITYIRGMFANVRNARFAVGPLFSMGGSSGMRSAQLMYNVRGRDYGEINKAADAIAAALNKSSGFVDVDTSFRGGKPEATVHIDRDRAADLGVPVAVIAMSIRTFFAGEKATELLTEGTRYDVRVQLDEKNRSRFDDILRLNVRSTSGQLVSLSSLVTVGTGEGPAKIERQNRMRNVTVMANLDGKALGDAVKEVDAAAKKLLPSTLQGAWTGMADIMKDSFAQLFSALILAIIMVYLILAAQFESFLHPFTIMVSLPLSLVGAAGALLASRMSLSIFSMIGIIMLMGLVTKNAILLVDYTNTLRRRGMSRQEALLAAGPVRLRPILMTTSAMIFGMTPVALALSAGGEQRAPMAVVVIGGLLTSMFLTLVVVPVVYSLFDSAKERIFAKRGPAAAIRPDADRQGAPGQP